MKKIILTFLLSTLSVGVFAQLTYKPNSVLDKFVGTWLAKTGTKTITITIKKIQVPIYNTKMDQLEGYLVHKDDGETLENSETPVLTHGINVSEDKIFQDKVFFVYNDRKKDKGGNLEITFSKTNPDEFTTSLEEQHRDLQVITPNTKKREKGFTLPIALVFRRQ
jgi:hypothetical protein